MTLEPFADDVVVDRGLWVGDEPSHDGLVRSCVDLARGRAQAATGLRRHGDGRQCDRKEGCCQRSKALRCSHDRDPDGRTPPIHRENRLIAGPSDREVALVRVAGCWRSSIPRSSAGSRASSCASRSTSRQGCRAATSSGSLMLRSRRHGNASGGDPERGLRLPAQSHHGQPGAGGSAQARRRLRPGDRGWDPRRLRPDPRRRWAVGAPRRAVARRQRPAGRGRPADGRDPAWRGPSAGLRPGRQRRRGASSWTTSPWPASRGSTTQPASSRDRAAGWLSGLDGVLSSGWPARPAFDRWARGDPSR